MLVEKLGHFTRMGASFLHKFDVRGGGGGVESGVNDYPIASY